MSKKPTRSSHGMREEYDSSGAIRGKFYREGATHTPPVHLDRDVLKFLQQRLAACSKPLNDLVNELLKKQIEMFECVGS